jgi:Flp pilus assembly protein TadD
LTTPLLDHRQALKFDPTSSFCLANLGLMLLEENNFTEAILKLKAALALNPDVPRGKYALGERP